MNKNNSTQLQQPHQAPSRRDWGDMLMHRWPTLLGIVIAALIAFDLQLDVEFVSFLSALIVVMALVYLGAAALNRRRSAWLVLLAGFGAIIVLRLLDVSIAPTVVLLVVALAFLVLGVVRDQWRRPGTLPLQAVGMGAFGAIALAVLYVDLDWTGYLIAAALLGHAVWDAIHLQLNRVVASSYAEFCAVFDLLLGAAILIMT